MITVTNKKMESIVPSSFDKLASYICNLFLKNSSQIYYEVKESEIPGNNIVEAFRIDSVSCLIDSKTKLLTLKLNSKYYFLDFDLNKSQPKPNEDSCNALNSIYRDMLLTESVYAWLFKKLSALSKH